MEESTVTSRRSREYHMLAEKHVLCKRCWVKREWELKKCDVVLFLHSTIIYSLHITFCSAVHYNTRLKRESLFITK